MVGAKRAWIERKPLPLDILESLHKRYREISFYEGKKGRTRGVKYEEVIGNYSNT